MFFKTKNILTLVVAYSCLCSITFAMADVTLDQIQEKIKAKYDIHDCRPFGADISHKQLNDVSLLWSLYRLEDKGLKDFIGLVLGCRQNIHLYGFEFQQADHLTVDKDIVQYIFHKDSPIKFIGSKERRGNNFNAFAYRSDTPEAEKNAYLLAIHFDRNPYLIGYLLGYDENDLELYYAWEAMPLSLKTKLNSIMDYIQYLYPRSFKDFFDNKQKDFIINQADMDSLRKRNIVNELERIEKEPDSHRFYLKTMLQEFTKVSKEFMIYLQKEWHLSLGYFNFLQDKELAQNILRESSGLSIDQLKKLLGDRMISHEAIIQKLKK
jgi:hypothetical protein